VPSTSAKFVSRANDRDNTHVGTSGRPAIEYLKFRNQCVTKISGPESPGGAKLRRRALPVMRPVGRYCGPGAASNMPTSVHGEGGDR
jgi:hypothetical protein